MLECRKELGSRGSRGPFVDSLMVSSVHDAVKHLPDRTGRFAVGGGERRRGGTQLADLSDRGQVAGRRKVGQGSEFRANTSTSRTSPTPSYVSTAPWPSAPSALVTKLG